MLVTVVMCLSKDMMRRGRPSGPRFARRSWGMKTPCIRLKVPAAMYGANISRVVGEVGAEHVRCRSTCFLISPSGTLFVQTKNSRFLFFPTIACQAACSPAMGRSSAQLSAPQAAVLLAVLALSAAVPGTAAPDRPKEAGPMGCATMNRVVWPDVPKEALTIFDNFHLIELLPQYPKKPVVLLPPLVVPKTNYVLDDEHLRLHPFRQLESTASFSECRSSSSSCMSVASELGW